MIEPIKNIKGKGLPLLGDDIDTDRIIPARFLRCVTFDGLGESAFYDERFAGGKALDHPMNDPKYKNAAVMISGNNFGCGSSREHAPQAIKRAGFKAVVAESFAEIFYGNSSVLGLVCVCLPRKDIEELDALVKHTPDTEIEIDVENRSLSAGGKKYPLLIKDTLRASLLNATYDTLAELSASKDKIAAFDKSMPPAAY